MERSLDEFRHKMKSLVQDQQNHLIRAVTCRGEYHLHPAFQEFEVSPSKWFGLNEASRSKHIQQLRNAASKFMERFQSSTLPAPSVSSVPLPNLSHERLHEGSSEDLKNCRPKKESRDSNRKDGPKKFQEEMNNGQVIEWVVKKLKNTTVPDGTIRNIFDKATELWADPQAITAAPVEGVARMVKSKSTPSRPHLVQVFKGAKIICDEACPMWKSLKLCSHCVAVAHSMGCVSGFIEWYAANAKKANITKLTTQNVPRSVGKKSSHARYSRSKGKTPVTARVAPVFTDQPPSSSIYNESISSSIYNQETEAIP